MCHGLKNRSKHQQLFQERTWLPLLLDRRLPRAGRLNRGFTFSGNLWGYPAGKSVGKGTSESWETEFTTAGGSVWVAVSQRSDVQQECDQRKWADCSACSVVSLPKSISAPRNRARPVCGWHACPWLTEASRAPHGEQQFISPRWRQAKCREESEGSGRCIQPRLEKGPNGCRDICDDSLVSGVPLFQSGLVALSILLYVFPISGCILFKIFFDYMMMCFGVGLFSYIVPDVMKYSHQEIPGNFLQLFSLWIFFHFLYCLFLELILFECWAF